MSETALVNPRRILIIKPSSLGDVVHALPVLHALRIAYPDARIAWMIGSGFADLLAGHSQIDELIRFDRARFGRMWRSPAVFLEFWRFVRDIRRRKFDLVVDLQGLIRSGIIAWLSGGRSVGFADAREFAWLFYSKRVRPDAAAIHAVEKNMAIAIACGGEPGKAVFDLGITAEERSGARALIGDAPFIAVLPGARWASKQWPPARFAGLVDRLAAEGRARCVLLGAPAERSIADAILGASESKPTNLVGRTSLRELVGLLELSEQVICLDSGPMHIAAALDKPVVALFGPTNPRRTGPYSIAARVVSRGEPCAPCYRRICPLGHHDCLEKLSVQAVVDELSRIA